MKALFFVLFVCAFMLPQTIEDVVINNIDIGYDENSLLISWSVPDEHVGIADWFNIFYCEAENNHINMLDSALYWFMSYDECWDWEHSRTYKYSIRITPQPGWGAYMSTIRIGIMPSTQFFWDEINKTMITDSITYGKLYLAPNILNKTPIQTDVIIVNSP